MEKFIAFKWTPWRVLKLILFSLFMVCVPTYLFCSLAAWSLDFTVWHWSLRGLFGVALILFVPLLVYPVKQQLREEPRKSGKL